MRVLDALKSGRIGGIVPKTGVPMVRSEDMREETRKRLQRALLLRRLKWAGLAVAGVVAATGVFYLEGLDFAVEATKPVTGTVVYVGPVTGKLKAAVAERNLQVDVELGDARVAHLMTPRERAPSVGDRVTIAEQIHGSGRHTFSWK